MADGKRMEECGFVMSLSVAKTEKWFFKGMVAAEMKKIGYIVKLVCLDHELLLVQCECAAGLDRFVSYIFLILYSRRASTPYVL